MKNLFIGASVCLLFYAIPAEAATVGEDHGTWGVIFRWVNFVLLFGGLGYLLRKPAQQFFTSRKEEVVAGLVRAKTAEEEANLRLHQIEQRLSRLSVDLDQLRSEAEAEAARDREGILAEARRDVDRLVRQSQHEIERVARNFEREIREQVADALVDRASSTLQQELTEDDQRRIVVRFLKSS